MGSTHVVGAPKPVRGLARGLVDYLEATASSVTDLVLALDATSTLVFVSPSVGPLLGYDPAELIGQPIGHYLHPRDRGGADAFFQRLAATDTLASGFECRVSRANGQYLWYTLSASRVATTATTEPVYVVLGRDISREKALESQMILNDRLASLGTMAAGVAHEINNPLAYVLSNLAFLAEQLADMGTTYPDLAPIVGELERAAVDAIDGAQRVRGIVADLRSFSRTDDQTPMPIDVADTLEIAVRMTQHELRHRAHLIRQYAPVPMIIADSARLGQVFVNLLLNAAQALTDGQPETSQIRLRIEAPNPRWVNIEVIDNGPGIEPELQSRIFDPFFTTKPQGVGTGLGLSVCHGIVTSLGGHIELESTVGKGTVVRVVLPAAEGYAPRAR